MFRGAALGDPRIVVGPVAAGHAGRSLALDTAPVQIRTVWGARDQAVGPARELVLDDLVEQVVSLLESGVAFTPRDGLPRPVEPGDIAVIVHTNAQLDLVHDALRAADVPSVRRTTSSVFRTRAGDDWVVLLEALEQPNRLALLRRLAITSFVGWDAAELDTRDLDALGLRLRRWTQIFAERGIAALFEAVGRDERLASRLLSRVDGERLLTDLRHVGEALHSAASAGRLGLAATLEWLRRRVREAHRDTALERSRRLDSDVAAVQIATVWASKGLEFPVVLVPFAWDKHVREEPIPLFHDDDGRRVRDVGGRRSGAALRNNQNRSRSEQLGEDLRLLYVALTRAQARVVTWWAPSSRNTECAALHRVLFSDHPDDEIAERVPVPDEATMTVRLGSRAVAGKLSVDPVDASAPGARRWSGPAGQHRTLAVATLGREIDATWQRTSYSSLTRSAHDAPPGVSSEVEVVEKDDEPATAPPLGEAEADLRDIASPMADLPGGTGFGTLVHAVLERIDPTAPDLETELREQVAAQLNRHGAGDLTPDVLTAALLPSLRTPLGPLVPRHALADIAPADRLPELDFELPLRGGDHPNGLTRLRDLVPLLREHLPAADPLAAYPDLLADPVLGEASLRGYLNGSIDAVLRVDGRYLVVDYKTNRLGEPDVPLTAWDYRGEAMATAMMHAHYPLQALLYDVALHRFLRWRVPDYDPAEHLGGVLYLFLRGMCGPGVRTADGTVPGVFAWRPPAPLVVALSDALARGVRR